MQNIIYFGPWNFWHTVNTIFQLKLKKKIKNTLQQL